jgi:hypothetical protein
VPPLDQLLAEARRAQAVLETCEAVHA